MDNPTVEAIPTSTDNPTVEGRSASRQGPPTDNPTGDVTYPNDLSPSR